MKFEIERMFEIEVIKRSESDYTSILILVEVPGKYPRHCIAYRKLNAITRDQTYPLPNIEERVEIVNEARLISTFDLVRGYWHVSLPERARRYAAFISPQGTFIPTFLFIGTHGSCPCWTERLRPPLFG